MDHADLVAEMHTVENLPTQDRLHLARMRRAQQLKVARQKEKEWQKMQSRRDRSLQHSKRNRRHITFENSVVLLEAAGRNDISEVNQLLQRGITPDASNEDGLTALHQCCIDNNIEMLKLLLDYGANVDAQDSDKWTPLHAAATCGHLHLVKILISRGANLLAVNTDGNMPYDLCDDEDTLDYIEAEMSKRGVTQELIDDTRALTEKQMLSDLMELTNSGGDLDIPDHQGATPLHIAAANGYTRVVEFLLEHHASVDAVDKDMWSPVHAAACWGHPEVLELLAQYGADLNAKNKDNETPSDICEDSEIRERIEQLKTEQESKRLAEAQRRRVRRSQSNNTRAQSVRRTSLRDKTLTTKKDAVEETRLRLQAQEVFVTPDSTTESKSISNGTEQTSSQSQRVAKNPSHTTVPNNNTHESEISSRRHLSNSSGNIGDFSTSSRPEITSTTKTFLSSSAISNPDITGQIQHSTSSSAIMNNNNSNHSISNHANNNNNTTNHNNNINNNSNNNNNHSNSGSSSSASRLNGSTGIISSSSVQSSGGFGHSTSYPSHIMETSLNSRRPPEGKDNEEFPIRDKMLINSSSSVSNLHKLSNDRSTEIFSASKENGKINVQVTVLVDNSLSGTTLANLKKQRSQSRSSTISENGSVIAATSHNITAAGEAPSSPISANQNPVQPIELVVSSSASDPQSSPVTKFSGVTGDVVSDSTRSKKCCILM